MAGDIMAQKQSDNSFEKDFLDPRGTKSFQPVSVDEILNILVHTDGDCEQIEPLPSLSGSNKLWARSRRFFRVFKL